MTAVSARTGAHREHRREAEEELVRLGRHEVFFGEELEPVGGGVQEARDAQLELADLEDRAVRADAVLDHRALAAIVPGQEGGHVEEEAHHDEDLDDRADDQKSHALLTPPAPRRRAATAFRPRAGARGCL
jgi:hypothetical protein